MSIRFKTTIAFFILSIIAVGLSVWGVSTQLSRGFRQIELDRATENQSQVKEAFRREIVNTETKVSDWSQWDDTYEFIENLNPQYIESNLNIESLVRLKIHGIIFVKDQSVRYATLLDPEKNTLATMSSELSIHATSSALMQRLEDPDGVNSDITIVDNLPVILSARGIFLSSGEGSSNGQIIFVKYVSPDLVQELRDITKLSFTVTPYTASGMTGALGKEMKEDEDVTEESHIHFISESVMETDFIVRDIADKPIMYMKLTIPRTIHLQGAHTMRIFLGISIFWGLSFIILVIFLLDTLVLRRLEKLNRHIVDIGSSKDTTKRLGEVKESDELGQLARTINSMLDSLEQTGKDLLAKNTDLEASKSAMLNILEDERDLENALKQEKASIEMKVAERTRELEGEKAKLLASINSLNIGYILTDIKGEIVASNDLIHEIFSLPGSALTLASINDRLGSEFDLAVRFRQCTGENKKMHDENVSMGGVFLKIYLVPVTLHDTENAQVIGAVLLVEDVTEQRVLERSKDEFFSIASHELRTPLTAIRGNSALIQQYYKEALNDASLAEMIDDMHDSSIRLIAIVNDFLDMSRLEMKKIEFSKTPFAIGPLISECIMEFQGVEKERQVVLALDPTCDASLQVVADNNKTKQVILNLISNAFKFTEKGHITISYQKDPAGQRVIITVADTGKGISASGQHLLFHKFQQAQDNTLTRDMTRGTGLGLYISKLMVEGMGGVIWLEKSQEGQGSTFAFSLPIASG